MNNTCKGNETPEFQAYWNMWQPHSRNTDGRALAREAFRRQVLKGAEPQDIVDGAAWFLRNINERTKDYVPLSATWLNREGWDGLCDKERQHAEHLANLPKAPNVVAMRATVGVRPPNHWLNDYEKKQEQA